MKQGALYLLAAVLGYLLGCLNGAILTSRLLLHEDVRSHGSGNAGLTNFLRTYGGWLSVLVTAVDLLKAVAACALARLLTGTDCGAMLGGVAAVAGHMFPVFFRFQGGKGILSGAAVALAMDWRVFLIILAVFLVCVVATRYVSLGSVAAAAVYPFGFLWRFWGDWITVALAFLLAIAAIARHHANIARLLSGTERKLSLHKHGRR